MTTFFWVLMDTIEVFSKSFHKVGEGANPLTDPTTTRNHVDTFERQFQDELVKQRAEAR